MDIIQDPLVELFRMASTRLLEAISRGDTDEAEQIAFAIMSTLSQLSLLRDSFQVTGAMPAER